MAFARPSLLSIAQWLTWLSPLVMLSGPAPLDITMGLVVLLFLAHSVHRRDFSWLRHRWVQVVLVLCAFMVLRGLLADDIGNAMRRGAAYLRFPLFAVALAYWVLPDAASRRRLWYALAVAIAFLAGDAILQYLHGTDLFGRQPERLYNDVVRLTGPFSNPRVGITILWCLFPLVLPLLQAARWRHRLLGMALLAASSTAIYLSGERTALLLLAMGLVLGLLCCGRARLLLLAGAVFALIPLALLSRADHTLLLRQVQETRAQLVSFADSAYGRTWQVSGQIAARHPVFGIGPKQFQNECRSALYGPTDTLSLDQRCPMHTHNVYLEWAVTYGGIGLVLFLLLAGVWLRDAFRHGRPWHWSPLFMGLAITLALRLWPVAVTPSQFVVWSAYPFWLVIGWLYAEMQQRRPPHA